MPVSCLKSKPRKVEWEDIVISLQSDIVQLYVDLEVPPGNKEWKATKHGSGRALHHKLFEHILSNFDSFNSPNMKLTLVKGLSK